MKKKALNIWLMAALACGLSISVTSCKDDDDEPQKEEPTEQEVQQKAAKFWSVVGQLVSVDDVTEDYEGKTFEATYGIADPTNATTRIVNTNDMKTAAQRFANLVDATGIDENTASYKWSDPEIGSMTYTKGGTAAEWATVDVDIKAVPGLQRIIYREGGEGDNGKFSGKAYYRFGDVVSRQVTIKYDEKKNNDDRGTITEYWICVRPAFGPEGKEDSHWVCVNTVSDKNYKYYKASTGDNYWLPTSLKTDKENMQNFAELLYAICNPEAWYNNIKNHHTDGKLWGFSGVPFFTDFKGANLKYHNQYFWQNVQKGWSGTNVIKKALNLDNLDALKNVVNGDAVRLLHKGYSWWFTTSWNCELWEAVYTSGTKDEELNMHHAEYNNPEQNMKEHKFDVREMGRKTENYDGFFRDGKTRWVIRHATGKELASNKKFDVKLPIEGVKEEYRYYRDVVLTSDLDDTPEQTVASGINNDRTKWNLTDYAERGHYLMGDAYLDENGHRWFVINMAGTVKDPNDKLKTTEEHAPIAELVTFDGLTTSPDGSRVTNLCTFNQTIRALTLLHTLFANGHNIKDLSTTRAATGQILRNIVESCDVDPRYLFFQREAKSKDTRNATHTCSVAYSDSEVTNGQPIYRFVYPIDMSNAEPPFFYWKHYVKTPDTTTEEYKENQFSNERICLNHVAETDYVQRYGKDFYACQPIVHQLGGTDKEKQPYRTEADPRAKNMANYFYNRVVMENETFAPDMWNEPVLMFRTTAVYDRGEKDYATVTIDGHDLTLIKRCDPYIVHGDHTADDVNDDINGSYALIASEWDSNNRNTTWLDGKLFHLPKWRETWNF